MGYIVEQDYLSTTAMDEALRMAAARAGLDFFGVTERFREEARQRSLFYQFDGHYNGDGQQFFAKSIAPFIVKKLANSREGEQ